MITKADIARALGVDPALVQRWEKRGMPVYSIEAAKMWRQANIRPRAKPGSAGEARAPDGDPTERTGSGGGEYWKAKIRRETAEASKAELELAELEGDLVRRSEVDKAATRMASALVQQLAPIPDRISSEFGVDEAQRSKLRQRLREELDTVRAELARAGMMADQ